MGVVDYKKLVEVSEACFYKNESISAVNKQYVKDFLQSYDVSLARKNIFLKQIPKLLEPSKDIKKDMNNSKIINPIFSKLREELSPPYYSTVVSCGLRFVRWLNDGDKPIGFKDIKNIAKSKQKRNLHPNDMITWEDGLEMCKHTTSIQLKAVIMAQLSAGFRPSEFIDLKFGDIEQKRSYLIAYVNGKTGERSVIIDKGSPYLSQWLAEHPTKNPKDPLWIMESSLKSKPKEEPPTKSESKEEPPTKSKSKEEPPTKSKSKEKTPAKSKPKEEFSKYQYPALTKQIRKTGKKAKLNKPLDFYNFRHSCAVLLGKWGVPVEIRAKNMGHSITVHLQTYGRFSIDDDLDMYDKANGIERNEHEADVNIPCKICQTINTSSRTHCVKCNTPLTLDVALKSEQDTKEQLDALQKQIKELQLAMDIKSLK